MHSSLLPQVSARRALIAHGQNPCGFGVSVSADARRKAHNRRSSLPGIAPHRVAPAHYLLVGAQASRQAFAHGVAHCGGQSVRRKRRLTTRWITLRCGQRKGRQRPRGCLMRPATPTGAGTTKPPAQRLVALSATQQTRHSLNRALHPLAAFA